MSGKQGVFVALYRGINVGGNNPVKMEALRAMHSALGHTNVKSYVQSGNVVFHAAATDASVENDIVDAFAETFGFSTRVMVRSGEEWESVVAGNPYIRQAAADPKKVHVAICNGSPDKNALTALLEKTGGPEAFTIMGRTLYFHAPEGVGRSKFAAGLERACGVAATARNWRTVVELGRLANEAAAG